MRPLQRGDVVLLELRLEDRQILCMDPKRVDEICTSLDKLVRVRGLSLSSYDSEETRETVWCVMGPFDALKRLESSVSLSGLPLQTLFPAPDEG